jgi:hypothetical protein
MKRLLYPAMLLVFLAGIPFLWASVAAQDETDNIDLLYFYAAASGPDVSPEIVLHWATASETDFYGFYIERCDPDGDNASCDLDQDSNYFELSELIPGEGDEFNGHEYQHTDIAVQEGELYFYRLHVINNDQSEEYEGPVWGIPGAEPTPQGSNTVTPTTTPTPTATPTATATQPVANNTTTFTATTTPTSTASQTATPTRTTSGLQNSSTPTPTASRTASRTPTATITQTPTVTPTGPTRTPTQTTTAFTATPSRTIRPPTETLTVAAPMVSFTPEPSLTLTPSETPTEGPTPTETAISTATLLPLPSITLVWPTAIPTTTTSVELARSFTTATRPAANTPLPPASTPVRAANTASNFLFVLVAGLWLLLGIFLFIYLRRLGQ